MILQVAVAHLVEVEMRSSAIRAVKKATTLESATSTTAASVDLAPESTDVVIETTDAMDLGDLQVIQVGDHALRHQPQDTAKVPEIAVTPQTVEITTTTAMRDAVHPAEESAAGPKKTSATTKMNAVQVSMAGRTEPLDLSHVNLANCLE